MRYTGGAVLAAFALAVGIIIGQGSDPASAPAPTPVPTAPQEAVVVSPDDVCVRMRAGGHDLTDEECARYRRNERLVEGWSKLNRTAPGRVGDPRRILTPDVVDGP